MIFDKNLKFYNKSIDLFFNFFCMKLQQLKGWKFDTIILKILVLEIFMQKDPKMGSKHGFVLMVNWSMLWF